jgi:hypothetical protein
MSNEIDYENSNFKFGDIIRNIGHLKVKPKDKPNKVYVYLLISDGKYKIGYAKNVKERIKSLQTGNPCTIKCMASKLFINAYKIEQMLHMEYEQYRINGSEEWYSFPSDIVEDIRSILS